MINNRNNVVNLDLNNTSQFKINLENINRWVDNYNKLQKIFGFVFVIGLFFNFIISDNILISDYVIVSVGIPYIFICIILNLLNMLSYSFDKDILLMEYYNKHGILSSNEEIENKLKLNNYVLFTNNLNYVISKKYRWTVVTNIIAIIFLSIMNLTMVLGSLNSIFDYRIIDTPNLKVILLISLICSFFVYIISTYIYNKMFNNLNSVLNICSVYANKTPEYINNMISNYNNLNNIFGDNVKV